MKRLLLTATTIAAFASPAFAIAPIPSSGNTASDTAIATAHVVQPISILKTTDMSFGKFTINDTTGNVVSASSGTIFNLKDPTTGDPVADISNTNVTQLGAPTHAVFAVNGEDDALFDIDLDPSVTLSGPGGNVDAALYMTAIQGHFVAGINQSFSVWGNLPVTSSLTAGDYSGTFSVSIQYQ